MIGTEHGTVSYYQMEPTSMYWKMEKENLTQDMFRYIDKKNKKQV